MTDLSKQVVIVTGAAGGFGKSFTNAFLAAGAKVAALDVFEEGLVKLSNDHRGVNEQNLKTWKINIANFDNCKMVVDDIVKHFGGLDVLINNAALGMGFVRDDHMVVGVGIDELTPDIWNEMVGVNLTGPWNMTKSSIEYLRQSSGGRIINVTTSFYGMLWVKNQPYGPSKSGFEAMSAGHAEEFFGDGITVNVVVPGGPADTPMISANFVQDRKDLVSPKAMTYPALWLCSQEGEGITGNRYLAGLWDPEKSIEENRKITEAPIAWPGLAKNPVWPAGKPNDK